MKRKHESNGFQSTNLFGVRKDNRLSKTAIQPEILHTLKISPDYLLQDELEENEISTIREIEALWEEVSPSKQALALAMIKAALEHKE